MKYSRIYYKLFVHHHYYQIVLVVFYAPINISSLMTCLLAQGWINLPVTHMRSQQ